MMLDEPNAAADAAVQAAPREVFVHYGLASGERWYVARTLPNRDDFAMQNLQRMGFRVYAPKFWRTVRHARKTRNVLTPLFPGYVFVIADLSRDRWRSVNGAGGVGSLVMNAELPMPVPKGVVEAIIERGILLQTEGAGDSIKIGQIVKIRSGPFADRICQLERLDQRNRVQVLLEMMGGKITVQLGSLTFLERNNSLRPACMPSPPALQCPEEVFDLEGRRQAGAERQGTVARTDIAPFEAVAVRPCASVSGERPCGQLAP
jgi:transcription antitermination factor NusG